MVLILYKGCVIFDRCGWEIFVSNELLFVMILNFFGIFILVFSILFNKLIVSLLFVIKVVVVLLLWICLVKLMFVLNLYLDLKIKFLL